MGSPSIDVARVSDTTVAPARPTFAAASPKLVGVALPTGAMLSFRDRCCRSFASDARFCMSFKRVDLRRLLASGLSIPVASSPSSTSEIFPSSSMVMSTCSTPNSSSPVSVAAAGC